MNNRISKIIETIRHKMAIFQIWAKNPSVRKHVSFVTVMFHDMDKVFTIAMFGDDIATKIHRKFAGHHQMMCPTQKQIAEAYIDWASARITKPSKPFDAIQTASVYYPHIIGRVAIMQAEFKGFK
jgi:hypothetical protein